MMNCIICNKPGCQSRAKAGWLCRDCIKACGGVLKWGTIRNMSVDEIKAKVEESTHEVPTVAVSAPAEKTDYIEVKHPLWGTTTKVDAAKYRSLRAALEGRPNLDKYIIINETAGTARFPQITLRNHRNRTTAKQEYPFDQILSWELIENGSSVTKGGLGAAAVGGALFGGAGAITGGIIGRKKTDTVCRELRVKVTMRSTVEPVVYIDFVQSPTKATSVAYSKALGAAHEVMSLLAVVCEQTSPDMGRAAPSSADEIRKYKSLLDDGIITEEEFAAKKKQLMGI